MNLTERQEKVLAVLELNGASTQRIAEMCGWPPRDTAATIKALMTRELVERCDGPWGMRSYALTPTGRRELERVSP